MLANYAKRIGVFGCLLIGIAVGLALDQMIHLPGDRMINDPFWNALVNEVSVLIASIYVFWRLDDSHDSISWRKLGRRLTKREGWRLGLAALIYVSCLLCWFTFWLPSELQPIKNGFLRFTLFVIASIILMSGGKEKAKTPADQQP